MFDELYWRGQYDKIIRTLPKRFLCKRCKCEKSVICFSVDFCSSSCNRNYDNDLEKLYGYQYEYDFDDDDDKYPSFGFQYPGWGKSTGFKGDFRKMYSYLYSNK
jgi:hypothetical protein